MQFWHNHQRNLKTKNLKAVNEAKEFLLKEKKELSKFKDIVETNKLPESFLRTNLGKEFQQFTEQVLVEIKNWNYLEERISRCIRNYQNGKTSINDFFDLTVFGLEYLYSTRKFKKLVKGAEGFSEKIQNQQTSRLIEKYEPFKKIIFPHSNFWIRIAEFLYGNENVREIFKPIVADWQEESFEALFRKEIWKARWINVRYTYAFLVAMWLKSPIGDLIEFISKFFK